MRPERPILRSIATESNIVLATSLCYIGVVLAVGLAFGELMRRLHQPAILGELIGCILCGALSYPIFHLPESVKLL